MQPKQQRHADEDLIGANYESTKDQSARVINESTGGKDNSEVLVKTTVDAAVNDIS